MAIINPSYQYQIPQANDYWNTLPEVKAWKAAHPNGIQTDADRESLGQIQQQYQDIIPQGAVVRDNGDLGPPVPVSEGKGILEGLLAPAGVLTAGAVIPALAGGGAGSAGYGGSLATDGLSTAADTATTSPAAAGSIIGGSGSPLSKIGKVAGAVQPILGTMAKAGVDANNNNNRNNLTAAQISNGEANTQLAQDQFALNAPKTRLNETAKASLLSHLTPSTVNWGGPGSGLKGQVPTFSGGANEGMSLLSGDISPLAQATIAQNLKDELAGKDSTNPYLAQTDNYLGKVNSSNPLDSGVGAASTLSSFINAYLNPQGKK